MVTLSLQAPIAFIDIESTGVNPQQDRIIEIGIIKLHPNGREEFLNSLINPGIPIPSEAIKIHGITDVDVAGKPSFREFSSKLLEFIKDCDLGGFAIKKFDLPILEAEFKRANIVYSREEKKIIDVLIIYHEFEPRDLKAAYKKYCNKDLVIVHRAETDVRATTEIFKAQLEQHDNLPKDILGLHEFCNKKDPNWVDAEGRFIWVGDAIVINFSKNKGRTLEDMRKKEPGFLNWILSNNFPPEVKKIVEDALRGKFPQK